MSAHTELLVVAGVLVVGIGTIAWASQRFTPPKLKDHGASKWYLFGEDCKRLVKKTQPTREDAEAFLAQQFAEYAKLDPLGTAPGDLDNNQQWAAGFAEHLFRHTVSPRCLAQLDAGAKMSADLAQSRDFTVMAAVTYLAERGYTVATPGLEAVDLGTPHLADIVRGAA